MEEERRVGPALCLGSSPVGGNRAQMSCCALLGSGRAHKIYHLCLLLPQPKPSWGGFAAFSDRSLAISSAGNCSSPDTALPFMCCTWLAPSFAGREPLAVVKEEASKDLLHSQEKIVRQPRKVRFPAVVFGHVIPKSIFCTSVANS